MELKKEITGYLRGVQLKFSRLYTRILSEEGITLPQYVLLNQLAGGEKIPMTEISARLLISKPAVTNLVDRLEKKKLLKRLPHATDRRIYLLEIQPKGGKIISRVQTHVLGVFLKTLDLFTPRERKTIARFYALLYQKIESVLGMSKGREI